MSTVFWLCLLAFICLIGETTYIVWVGKVSAGPFTYAKKEHPFAFYATMAVLFTLAAVSIGYVLMMYGLR